MHAGAFLQRVLLLLALAGLAACVGPPPRPETLTPGDYRYVEAYLAWLIPREMAAHDVAGLSIALVDDQRIVWARGFGEADREQGIAATPDTIYRAASLSKLLTATAVMQLADRGDIDIDQPLRRYLPEFSIRSRFPDAGPITVRQLLTHHAGLPFSLYKDFWRDVPLARLVEVLHDEHTAFPPGYVESYSNLGYDLLGRLLERMYGTDFANGMQAALLQPLGMTHSGFGPAPAPPARLAMGYRNGAPAPEPGHGRDIPAGGLYSSVLDLARFMQMVFAGGRAGDAAVIRPQTLAAMFEPQQLGVALDLDIHNGLGWFLGNRQLDYAGTVASHSGATLDYRSRMIVLPEHKLGIVVLSNSSTANPVIGKAAVRGLQLALEAKTGRRPPPPEALPPVQPGPVSEAVEQQYAGIYATGIGLVTIRAAHGELRAELDGRVLRLVPRATGEFGVQYRLLGFVPVPLGSWDETLVSRQTVAGQPVLVAHRGGYRRVIALKVESGPIPPSWQRRLGRYRVINQDDGDMAIADVRLEQDHGTLVFAYRLPEISDRFRLRAALAAQSDSEAVLLGFGRGLGETIDVVTAGQEERLRFSGLLLQREP